VGCTDFKGLFIMHIYASSNSCIFIWIRKHYYLPWNKVMLSEPMIVTIFKAAKQ